MNALEFLSVVTDKNLKDCCRPKVWGVGGGDFTSKTNCLWMYIDMRFVPVFWYEQLTVEEKLFLFSKAPLPGLESARYRAPRAIYQG
jgi:hypothetical protein